jgi:hypothetical protein
LLRRLLPLLPLPHRPPMLQKTLRKLTPLRLLPRPPLLPLPHRPPMLQKTPPRSNLAAIKNRPTGRFFFACSSSTTAFS